MFGNSNADFLNRLIRGVIGPIGEPRVVRLPFPFKIKNTFHGIGNIQQRGQRSLQPAKDRLGRRLEQDTVAFGTQYIVIWSMTDNPAAAGDQGCVKTSDRIQQCAVLQGAVDVFSILRKDTTYGLARRLLNFGVKFDVG